MALFQFIKLHKLQNEDDPRIIHTNEKLKAVFGVDRFEFGTLSNLIHSHLLPPDPVHMRYRVKLSGDPTEAEKCFDIDVEVEDDEDDEDEFEENQFQHQQRQLSDYEIERNRIQALKRRKDRLLLKNEFQMRDKVEECDEQLNNLVQKIYEAKRKRDFMLAFLQSPPAEFFNQFLQSQLRDYRLLKGDKDTEEEQRFSTFFYQPFVSETVSKYFQFG
eukprot:TRINITY_DN9313_c0_g1_i1.p1 TRINITY_DN9313_c0_g1~~TRINITY_DN9313_c0_g1_i1.p1  ORF type:complete len:217 (+),score=63.20 TRINITY_DN9313_c0_g1_i1:261-911(+)